MTGLIVDLPKGSGAGAFDWLLGRMRSGDAPFANDIVSFRTSDSFGLSVGEDALASIALAAVSSDEVEVASGVTVQAVDAERLTGFLRDQWRAFDHLGINLSYLDLHEAQWQRLIGAVGAMLPAYRLEIGSANDVVMIVMEDAVTGRASVLELVYDRGARRSSFHVCARVAADRAQVEDAFPAPYGAYKPGDEPFFRSVALPYAPNLPSYLDLAFSDAEMAPWPQIVAAMGKRIA
ncbi:MAG: hypothetical protein JWM91_4165 [Rhodospirillales bacterium]|nr:hypothetical protein [Rhodospirillales bacterium]